MSTIKTVAERFFDDCETGKGWETCKQYCHDSATFSSQTGALQGIETIEAYSNWMQGFFTPVPDGHYELKCFAADEERKVVVAFAVFHGTQTGPGGPGEPTGNKVAADYVYAMAFEGDRIKHLTKIWNDTISLQQLGWV